MALSKIESVGIATGAVGATDIANGAVGATQLASGAVGATQLASTLDLTGKTVTLPAGVGGKVLQVAQAGKNDVFSTTSSTWTDITGLSVSITPSSTSNKILILPAVNITGYSDVAVRLMRDSTVVGSGTGATNNVMYMVNTAAANPYGFYLGASPFLDSPSTTSSVTYKIQIYSNNTYQSYVNRRLNDANFIGFSSITVMEIAA